MIMLLIKRVKHDMISALGPSSLGKIYPKLLAPLANLNANYIQQTAKMNAPAAANNAPPPPPPPLILCDLALLPNSNGVATNRADPTRGYILVVGQNALVQRYLVNLSTKFCKRSLVTICTSCN
jgi:hypothetical protein